MSDAALPDIVFTPLAPVKPLAHHEDAIARGANCLACPLYNCGQGPVLGKIVPGSVMTLIEESPSNSEIETGQLFSDFASDTIFESLAEGGVEREQVSYTSAISCRPPGGHMLEYLATLKAEHKKRCAKAKAAKEELPQLITPQDCCAPRLARDIEEAGSKVLLSLGTEALKATASQLNVPFANAKVPPGTPRIAPLKKQHGSPVVTQSGRVVTSAMHPLYAIFGNSTFLPVIKKDIERAARIAVRGGLIDWREPEFILKPSIDTCINVMRMLQQAGSMITVDVETDGVDVKTTKLRCVGLGGVVDGREIIIVIPLRHMNGHQWWSPGDLQRLQHVLTELLESNPLSGHNLLFDTAVLLNHGILKNRAKRWFDCYLDDETEFLTSRGWLKYDDVRPSDLLATIAPNNTLQWQHYTDRVDKQRRGFLYEVETAHTRAVITPGHTIWHQPRRRTAEGQQAPAGPWQLTPAERLVLQSPDSASILQACLPEQDSRRSLNIDDAHLTEDFMRLMGLAICDGTVRMHRGQPYRLRISQKLHGRAYALLEDCRERFGLHEYSYERTESHRKTACIETVWEFRNHEDGRRQAAQNFVRWFGRKSIDRRLPAWALTMPPALRRALLQGLLLGDASEVGVATMFRSYSKHLADDVQALALTLGIPATLHRSGKCHVVNLRLDQGATTGVVTREDTKSVNGVFSRRPDAEYRVVCFVVPNHTLVTRSSGRPAFYGNTMIAHHDTDQSELPHDLGFVAARFFEAMRWKDDADHKNVEGVDDYWLHLYCAKDVLGEMRLIVPLAQQIDKNGTINAFKTDTALAPVARDMGDLGINIDEQRRRKFFDILDRATAQLTIDIQRITGIPDFNPNAFKQVSRFLFVIKGLSPPYATDGREWSELSDEDEEVPLDTDDPEVILAKAATNELSLLRLLELGVDEQTRQFIEAELMYRGLQKCKATYIGLKAEGDGDDRRIIDTHRERGYIHTENHGPGLMNLSILSASWKVHITPTGRWATSPNVQNWPERVVYSVEKYRDALKAGRGTSKKPFDIDGGDGIINTRAMVIAVPGHTLVGADYAAIELRIYAIQAGDALLLDAIRTGKDPHALNYATMMARNPGEVMTWYERVKNSPEQVKKYLRNIAKRFAFLVIYGGQKDQLFKTMSADREPDGTRSFPDLKPGDCAMWFDNFHRAHPETRIWQERVVRAWQTHGFVATILDGRRRFFIGGIDQTAMPNMTIQGSAAAIMNRAMQQIAVECPHRGWSPMSGPILQVHDFAGLQTPEERGVEGMQLLKRVMPYEHNGMRFDVEEKMGKTWNVI